MKKEPGYKSWKYKAYPKDTEVFVFSNKKRLLGVGRLMSGFPSPVVLIEYKGDVLFGGDDIFWIPRAELGKELLAKVVSRLKVSKA